jgi:Ran GTPase-activating protein (RanGAP) involved in mRNA processing and transport
MRLPVVVRLSRNFWNTNQCRISTLELPRCEKKGQDAERLAEVLAQCRELAHLDLSGNSFFGAAGTERLAGVLGQCWELVHLDLSSNLIKSSWAASLAGVLGHSCTALAHLDLGQRNLHECWGSAQRWLTSISASMKSALLGEEGFEHRGVVKLLVFFSRNLALLALCHLFSRHATRNSDSFERFELKKSE